MAIPRFHMVCPPFREPVVRTVKSAVCYYPVILHLPSCTCGRCHCASLLALTVSCSVVVLQHKPSTSFTPRLDDHDPDDEYCDGDGDDFGDLRGINMAALEGAWCPRHI